MRFANLSRGQATMRADDLWFQFSLGQFTVTMLHDQPNSKHSTRDVFSLVPEADINRLHIAHEVTLSHTAILVQTPTQNVLIDAGWGQTQPNWQGRIGTALEQLGIAPDDIDVILLTHAHADHYAGMLTATGEKVYPRARYLMWHDEWAYYTSAEVLDYIAAHRPTEYDRMQAHLLPLAPHLDFLSANHLMVVPGITVLPAPGHTKHHVALKMQSAGETLVAAVDAFIHPLQLNQTAWHWQGDYDAVLLRRSREALLGLAMDTDALLAAYHFPTPAVGKLFQQGETTIWQPLTASSNERW